jgi:uncharacterized protein
MLDVLARWNRWGTAELPGGVERDATAQLLPFLSSPEVVVLIGPRRAGKTTVLFQVMDYLEKTGVPQEAMLHINLEEPALTPKLDAELLDRLYNTYRTEIFPKGRAYLFLDEIQNVHHWERWVRARNEIEDIKIFITGSSSQLMSRELGTLLTGRHVSFKILPLSFREVLRFKSIEIPTTKAKLASPTPTLQHALNSYLQWGGFPEVVLAHDDRRKEVLLKQYFDDVLFKDVVIRHKIRDAATLRNVAVFLLTQTASLISFQRVAKIFGVSLHLAQAYCQYLQEAFLVDLASFCSRKVAERNRNPQKVHAVDVGLRNAVSLAHSEDKGRLMETMVYNAIQRNVNDGVFYWKRDVEVDLLVRRGNSIETMIQVVAEGLECDDVQQRELLALEEAGKQFSHAKKIIITGKPLKKPISTKMEIIPLWKYLLSI